MPREIALTPVVYSNIKLELILLINDTNTWFPEIHLPADNSVEKTWVNQYRICKTKTTLLGNQMEI